MRILDLAGGGGENFSSTDLSASGRQATRDLAASGFMETSGTTAMRRVEWCG